MHRGDAANAPALRRRKCRRLAPLAAGLIAPFTGAAGAGAPIPADHFVVPEGSRAAAVLSCVAVTGCTGQSGSAPREEAPPAAMGPAQIISEGVVGARGLGVADLDADDYVDVLAASEYEGEVFWFRNENGKGFADGVVITDTFASALTVNAGDLTGDGLADVIVGGDERIEWYENAGNGRFATGQLVSAGLPKIIRVSVADLDADGDSDIISASKWKVAWFENRGSGAFGPPRAVNLDVRHVNWTDAADFNNDRRLDIFAITYEYEYSEINDDPSLPGRSARNDNVVWHPNLDGGRFGPAELVWGDAGAIQSHVRSGDLDGDGWEDLVSCLFFLDQVVWYRNQPHGGFSGPRIISKATDGPEALLIADLDADGDADIVSASLFDGMFMLHRNLGDGTFGDTSVLARDVGGATALEGADVDRDGDIDVIAAAEFVHTILWFENTLRRPED